MSIVTVQELQDYMSGIGLAVDQQLALQDVLDGVQRELERYCQRPLERMERTEAVFPDDAGRLWPKATPIVSVSAPVGLVPNGANYLSGYYPTNVLDPAGPVVLTYVGGLVGVEEDDVRLAILRVAAREATDRHDDVRTVTDLEGRQARRTDTREVGWTDDELKKFDRLRRRTVA